MGLIDLHTHSNCSDGTMTPRELICHAYDNDVRIIALTDHDTVGGLAEAEQTVKEINERNLKNSYNNGNLASIDIQGAEISKSNASIDSKNPETLHFIPGIEFAAYYKVRDVHILGLFIDKDNSDIKALTSIAIADRNDRNERMMQLMRDDGYPITINDLSDVADKAAITRAHFAKYFIDHGLARNRKEAFDKYLNPGQKYYLPRKKLSPENAVKAVLSAGGIPVLAHPLLYKFNQTELETLIKDLISYGLLGLEVYYSSNINNDTDYVYSLAKKFNLIMTGGSDFHGANKPDLAIGTGKGNLYVPHSILDSLPLK